MGMTITLGKKRKSRYFVLFYGVKNVLVPAEKKSEDGRVPEKVAIPMSANGNGKSDIHYSTMGVKMDPEPTNNLPTPHISWKQAVGLVEKNNPNFNYVVITNVKEMNEVDFKDWSAGSNG